MTSEDEQNQGLSPRISLEQWRALVAVVEAGGYAQAADALHKSQSSVTYAVQKLEELLAVHVFEIRGRKAVLTPTGEMLYRRARGLLEDAGGLERAARKASAGWESEIALAVEVVFPTWLMLDCLNRFGLERRACECYAISKREFDRLLGSKTSRKALNTPSKGYSNSMRR